MTLTFADVTTVNIARAKRWHSDFLTGRDTWTGADWANALAGEVGEACNVVKKLRRIDTNTMGRTDPSGDALRTMLAAELADVFIYLDLLATFYGVDLPAAIASKFNEVSERNGFPERIGR